KYNAAVGQGMDKEATELKAAVDLLNGMIKGRQTLLGDDGFSKKVLDDLEELIALTKKGLENDKKRTDEVLADLGRDFTASAPVVEKLPEEQKALAEALQGRLDAMTAAREAYASSVEDSNAESNVDLKKLEEDAASTAAKIEQRRIELAAQSAKDLSEQQKVAKTKALEEKRFELEAVKKHEASAQAAFATARKQQIETEVSATAARDAGERADDLSRQRDAVNADLTQQRDTLKRKQADLAASVEPIEPTAKNVEVIVPDDDPRLIYVPTAVVAVFCVFAAMILFSLKGSGGPAEPPLANVAGDDGDDQGADESNSSPRAPSHLARARADSDLASEDDSEAVVV
ncbi:MAG: hypothetical protein ACREIT_02270, partial [Tepidisphaeraceae bacterium]